MSRAKALWTRLCGLFGSEALARKFGETPPPEWVAALSRLSEIEIERGLRRLVYSGASHVPTLPEFMKLARTVGSGEQFGEPRPPNALPAPSWSGDAWDAAANPHLLAHITRMLKADPQRYGRAATYLGMRVAFAPNADASGEFIEAMQTLVAAKKLWAEEMRITPEDVRTVAYQREQWTEFMAAAETQIDAARHEARRAVA